MALRHQVQGIVALTVLALVAPGTHAEQTCPTTCQETFEGYTLALHSWDPLPRPHQVDWEGNPYACAWLCKSLSNIYTIWLRQEDDSCLCLTGCKGPETVLATNHGGIISKCPEAPSPPSPPPSPPPPSPPPPPPPPPPLTVKKAVKQLSKCGKPDFNGKATGGVWVTLDCGDTPDCTDVRQYCCIQPKQLDKVDGNLFCIDATVTI